MKFRDFLNEAKGYDVIEELFTKFDNKLYTKIVEPGKGFWKDKYGNKFKEPGRVELEKNEFYKKFYDWVKTEKGVKYVGKVTDSMKSNPTREAYSYRGKYISFVMNGTTPYAIEWGDLSRLKNDSVWELEK